MVAAFITVGVIELLLLCVSCYKLGYEAGALNELKRLGMLDDRNTRDQME